MRSPKQDLQTIPPEHPDYPAGLKTCITFKTAPTLTAIGNLSLPQKPAITRFCSINSPKNLALQQRGIIFLDFDALKQSLLLNPPMDLVG
jgi:hypothetical protein